MMSEGLGDGGATFVFGKLAGGIAKGGVLTNLHQCIFWAGAIATTTTGRLCATDA